MGASERRVVEEGEKQTGKKRSSIADREAGEELREEREAKEERK